MTQHDWDYDGQRERYDCANPDCTVTVSRERFLRSRAETSHILTDGWLLDVMTGSPCPTLASPTPGAYGTVIWDETAQMSEADIERLHERYVWGGHASDGRIVWLGSPMKGTPILDFTEADNEAWVTRLGEFESRELVVESEVEAGGASKWVRLRVPCTHGPQSFTYGCRHDPGHENEERNGPAADRILPAVQGYERFTVGEPMPGVVFQVTDGSGATFTFYEPDPHPECVSEALRRGTVDPRETTIALREALRAERDETAERSERRAATIASLRAELEATHAATNLEHAKKIEYRDRWHSAVSEGRRFIRQRDHAISFGEHLLAGIGEAITRLQHASREAHAFDGARVSVDRALSAYMSAMKHVDTAEAFLSSLAAQPRPVAESPDPDVPAPHIEQGTPSRDDLMGDATD